MFDKYSFTVREKFLRYVTIDTQSDPHSKTSPSTEKQFTLSRLLAKELQAMGIADASVDLHGYVYATIPSNSEKKVPVICFCSHVDTAPDCTGAGVKPIVHENYSGADIVLPDDPTQVITTREHPYLSKKIGEDIITASGTTLLGADDKAGVAVIMDMANYLITHPEVKHGAIRILFTTDEEIGRGVDHVNMEQLGAEFGYTLDAGERGVVEDETFSADAITFTFYGVSAHPGYGKDKLVNAIKVASAFIDSLPKDELSPETTDGRYGFVHPVHIEGIGEKVTVEFILRDFVTGKLTAYADYLRDKANDALKIFPGARVDVQVREQYRNMKEVLDQYPQVAAFAKEAVERAGMEVIASSARGGTDGSRLSFMGLPCPNLFTGEMAFHGKHEYVSVQDMEKAVEMTVHLAAIWEEKGSIA
ncbi:peptidase T [Pseudobacter ginsenosidimutans]|uniref:Peptidase T n=1 Tax=Pseudobacter ginsenosidimutans TaxID=661488 RepID=A0A4Q7MG58_9BACT|nr:peptidase T [Pseudobacter ginsenosidimutans]QEC45550.1 peptidase T [Pseudobacter ginsenosidimutans]RZS67091.1 tripeptide aminopeptidase [Pseudobacter ginsenosidimutans]